MTTTTTVSAAPSSTPAAVSPRLSLIGGVTVLIAAIVGIAVVAIVRPSQTGSADTVILTLAVPAVAGLFLAARISYTAGALLSTQEQHGATLTTIQTQLNGQLEQRIENVVRKVLTEVAGVGAALFPGAVSSPPAAAAPIPAQPTGEPAPAAPLM